MLAHPEPKAICFDSFLFTYGLEETSSANDLQIVKIKYKPARPGIISHGSFTPWGGMPERFKKLQWCAPVISIVRTEKRVPAGCSILLLASFLVGVFTRKVWVFAISFI